MNIVHALKTLTEIKEKKLFLSRIPLESSWLGSVFGILFTHCACWFYLVVGSKWSECYWTLFMLGSQNPDRNQRKKTISLVQYL